MKTLREFATFQSDKMYINVDNNWKVTEHYILYIWFVYSKAVERQFKKKTRTQPRAYTYVHIMFMSCSLCINVNLY